MSVWSTLKRALGLDVDPGVRGLDAVELTPGAERRLGALPRGHGIRVHTSPIPQGHMVHVTEGVVAQGHPAFDELPVACDEADLARLAGLKLDHDGERWRVVAEVDVRARETPNPNSRLYLTDRVLTEGRLSFGPRSVAVPWLAQQLLQRDDVRSVLFRDRTITVERTVDRPWDPIDLAVATAVREHVLAAGGLLKVAASPGSHDELEQAVWQILQHRVLPGIHQDGGDLELVGIEDGVVRVHLVGACRSCPASTLTLKHGIERALKDAFPGEIDAVEAVD